MKLQEAAVKAATLAQALPYIKTYRGNVVVVKVGGAACDDPRLAGLLAEDLALLGLVGLRLVVVHGGGPQISAAMRRAGIEPEFRAGLRVTSDATMDVVQQVLLGTINSDLVRRLNEAGLPAVGLSGLDGATLQAKRAAGAGGADIGRVGEIVSAQPALLHALLDAGYTPVVASVAPDANAVTLNVNADEAAAAIAAAVGAAKLVYVTNVEGLYSDFGDETSLISEIKAGDLAELVPSLSTGMRPKASAALAALEGGVPKVHILDGRVEHALLLEVFTDEGVGTQVVA